MLTTRDIEWLNDHEAIVRFKADNPTHIEFRRSRDMLRVGCQAWTLDNLMAEARELDRRGEQTKGGSV